MSFMKTVVENNPSYMEQLYGHPFYSRAMDGKIA